MAGLSGAQSVVSGSPSLSSSPSTQSGWLSPSVLVKPSSIPSFRSLSTPSQTSGVEAALSGSEPTAVSAASEKLSLSSSEPTQSAWPSPSVLVKPSSIPSLRSLSTPSQTSGVEAALRGSEPAAISAASEKLSLSSSLSTQSAWLSPSVLVKPSSIPSLRSLSIPSQTSGVEAALSAFEPEAVSAASEKLSLSSSLSTQSAWPSPSVLVKPSSIPSLRSLSIPSQTSGVEAALSGSEPAAISVASETLSLSSSLSTQSAWPSPSVLVKPSSIPSLRSLSIPSQTSGVEAALSGSEPAANSSESVMPSLSSSGSQTFPIPSLSVSVGSAVTVTFNVTVAVALLPSVAVNVKLASLAPHAAITSAVTVPL